MARTKAAKAVTYAETTTAVIGSVEYTTLQLAIDNVADNETVQLVKSVSESVTIPENKTFTLDLGSNTLTNTEGNHTINNKGTVTITGSGTVDNISNEKAALWNDGTATLTGNTYTRSQETGIDDNESGGNSYYTIVNHGTMTINDGTNVNQNGKFSSLVENGWYNGSQNTSSLESVLTIEGGTFTNIPEDDDLSQFFTEDSKFETGEDGTITVEPKIDPTIEIQNLPSIITVGTTTDFSVHITPNDYDGDNCLVDITYSGENALSRENGGLSLQYEDNTGWHDLLSDTFGPPETGFPLSNNLTSNFKVTGNREGNTTVTLTVRKVERNVNLCSTSQSVQFTAVEPEPTKYTVTVTGGTGSGEYEEGASVTCVATIPEGKEFDVWEVTGITGAVLGNSTLTFAMPANDVTCTAKFKDKQPQPSEDDVLYITVEEGDSIWGFARRFKMSVDKIMADNNITEYRRLYSGEVIKIYDNGNEVIVPHTDFFIG